MPLCQEGRGIGRRLILLPAGLAGDYGRDPVEANLPELVGVRPVLRSRWRARCSTPGPRA